MGVRISWLMLARNSLLARLAACAASSARCRTSISWRNSAVRSSTRSASLCSLRRSSRTRIW